MAKRTSVILINISILITYIVFFIHPAFAGDRNLLADSSQIIKKRVYKVIAFESAYYFGSLLVLQNTWYSDRKLVPFHFFNDNKDYLQVDKFGHAFGSYAESYIGYHWLKNSGVGKTKALILGGTLGLIMQTPIEIMDGIHEGWGFSWGDMAANAFGSAFVIGQELLWNEQLIKYKFSYWESSYSKRANGYLGKTSLDRLLKDYNGHTYWLSMPLNKIITHKVIPSWLNIAAGYGANGMYGEYENISNYNGVEIAPTTRYRQYLLSLDIDWTKIKTHSKLMKTIFTGMTFIKLPFPAFEISSEGNLKGYLLYY